MFSFSRRGQVFRRRGNCPICERAVLFTAENSWFRDHLLCSGCGSIPRERALMRVLRELCPDFRELSIHESSPGGRGVSSLLRDQCADYTVSHFFAGVAAGDTDPATGARCENLEQLTFGDAVFDLFITQDVLEHVFEPEAAAREIARVLKPGAWHVFTVPMVRKFQPSVRRASRTEAGDTTHHLEPQYHGNPVDAKGSLVTMDWGYELASVLDRAGGTNTVIMQIDDIDAGIRAEYIEVLVSHKPG